MKNNFFFKRKVYACDLKNYTLSELLATDNYHNWQMSYRAYTVGRVVSPNEITVQRTATAMADIRLAYCSVNKSLTLEVKPMKAAFVLHVTGLFLFGQMVSKGGTYKLITYTLPLFFILLGSVFIAHSVYEGFEVMKFVIEDTLRKKKLNITI